MYYYQVAILKSPLQELTYQSDTLLQDGQVVQVSLRNFKTPQQAVVIKQTTKPTFKCSNIEQIQTYYYDSFILQVAKFISQYYVSSLGEALGLYVPFDQTIKLSSQESKLDDTKTKFQQINLSDAQQKSFEFIQNHTVSLLFADTGSGKTEIYIKLIAQTLLDKKQAVMLLPEISLTPQMEQRLTDIFGTKVAIWHSKITKQKKETIINDLLTNKIWLIAGARSALFLPYDRLGLIIVDEEHDTSYKSSSKPRVNVKDLAIYIGNKYNIKTILGSATPSLNSFVKVPHTRITQTYYDTTKEFIFDNSPLGLSNIIVKQLTQTLDNNNQAIIFLPTRANYKYQICSNCGQNIECPFCSVSLSLHKNNNALVCHYCNYTQQITKKCPMCQDGIMESYRIGTAEVVEQLKQIFPNHTIEKFDKDSITTQKKLKTILKKFNDNKIDILVGTQMLSKGHNYHNVKLAVIIGIDSVLKTNSYKSRENALSLLIQIAGRSGRKGKGEVIIQTKHQEFFSTYLQQYNYKDFLLSEIELRKKFFPPFVRFAKIIFSHKNQQKAHTTMQEYIQKILHLPHNKIEIVRYGQSVVFKIASKYRYEILLRSNDIKALLSFLHSISNSYATIDMDCIE
jgi:primosomal protein N' (replication factor Y)